MARAVGSLAAEGFAGAALDRIQTRGVLASASGLIVEDRAECGRPSRKSSESLEFDRT